MKDVDSARFGRRWHLLDSAVVALEQSPSQQTSLCNEATVDQRQICDTIRGAPICLIPNHVQITPALFSLFLSVGLAG